MVNSKIVFTILHGLIILWPVVEGDRIGTESLRRGDGEGGTEVKWVVMDRRGAEPLSYCPHYC